MAPLVAGPVVASSPAVQHSAEVAASLAQLDKIEENLRPLFVQVQALTSGAFVGNRSKHIAAQNETITAMMERIDSVESHGADAVRQRRKAILLHLEQTSATLTALGRAAA
jgi:hypothetical protein